MPKNTFLLTLALAIVAAAVIGINFTRKNAPGTTPAKTQNQASPIEKTATSAAHPTPVTAISGTAFTYTTCGVTFSYPKTHQKFGESTSPGIFFINPKDQNDAVYVGCAKEIPIPTLSPDKIEYVIAGADIQGTLYHDISQDTKTPVNKFIFTHPKNGQEVIILGTGSGFDQLMTTLAIIQ